MKTWLLSVTRKPWGVLPILWGAWALLLARLDSLSLWIDEWFTVDIIRTSWAGFLPHIIATERRPPLHYALLKLWAGFTGNSEFTLRVYSTLLALLAIAVLYALGRHLENHRVGFCAALLLAGSPFVVLYGRMIRGYSQTMMLGILATWLFLRALRKPCKNRWGAYGLSVVALLYTDYSGIPLVGSHFLCLLLLPQNRKVWRGWTATFIIALLACTPLLPIILTQKEHPVRLTDLAREASGFVLKFVYPLYSWGAGETIFPWHPAALPGVMACSLLWLLGLVTLFRTNRAGFWLLISVLGLSLLFMALLTTFIATDIPFINSASRIPAVAAMFYLGVASGWIALSRCQLRWASGFLIVITFTCSLWNYYHGQQFHNPIYAVPIRQIVEEVRKKCAPGDLIIAEADTLFGYYYNQNPGPALYQEADYPANKVYIKANRPNRVWLVTFGRDSTIGVGRTEELTVWLREVYPEVVVQGYVPQDPIYRRVKEFLLRRPAYAYKLMVRIYSR
jgi:hypothetical protein